MPCSAVKGGWPMFEDVLKQWAAVEVTAMDLYSDMFQLGSGLIQKSVTEFRNKKSNPLGYWKNENHEKGHYRIMFDDTFEDTLKELQDADFSIINGITYFGRKNTQASAGKMYAMIFDLDGVTDKTLNNFLSGAIRAEAYPIPNYIALSGHGVHLYYVFDEPVSLYPNIKTQLKDLKYGLIRKMWNRYTSTDEKVQYQGINQGFRPIGGRTKIDGVRVRAFRLNMHPVTLGYLGNFVPEEYRVDEKKIYKESKLTLEQAKEKYPEWYQRRIVEGSTLEGHWVCKRDLYDWWIRKIKEGATYGHRYFAIMCLAIYAVKSGIDEDELQKDAAALIPHMNILNPDEPFTITDVVSALECYDERYFRFPIDDISRLSAIPIEKNKRNGRKQKIHLARARAVQMIDYPDGEWRKGSGRKSKESIVQEWRLSHPEGRKAECVRQTGLAKSTVYKWW